MFNFILVISIIANMVLGYLAYKHSQLSEKTTLQKQIPAYLVAGWSITSPDKVGPFTDAVIPLAEEAGFIMLAGKEPALLEGEWPYPGITIVQKYDSMEALKDFWNGAKHGEVKKLREGLIDSHFVIAVEGLEVIGLTEKEKNH